MVTVLCCGAVRSVVAVWCSKLASDVMARLNQDMAGLTGTLGVVRTTQGDVESRQSRDCEKLKLD